MNGQFVDFYLAAGMPNNRGAEDSHHLVEEALAFKNEFDFLLRYLIFDGVNGSHRVLGTI